MKLCFLAGANSIHSHRWITYFARTGHDVTWISFAPTISPIDPTIRYHEIRPVLPGILGALPLARATGRIVRNTHPDLVHAHSAGIYGFAAYLIGFHPFVLTAWGSDVLLNPRSIVKRIAVRRILRAADVITCDGENTKEAMTRLGARAELIRLIRFGVDTEKFKPGPGDKKALFGSDDPVVISVRSLNPVYDIETFIRAAKIVSATLPHIRFVIGGDGEQKEYLKTLARSLGLEHVVTFVGAIAGDAMPSYFRAADIYVSTALSDSDLAASTAEAMATELPVVVTDSGDNRKWIRNGENGYVIPVKSPEALAEKIAHLLTHPEDRARFARANRALVKERNDYRTEMGKMGNIYEKTSARR